VTGPPTPSRSRDSVFAIPPAPMSRKKISTTIYITPEQNDRLKLLHERTKVPIAVYIREGIDMVLKHYEHILPGQMSLEAASGQKKS
jgi:predicted DNA-binding protein